MVGIEEGDKTLEGYSSIHLKGKVPWIVCLSQELLDISTHFSAGKKYFERPGPVEKTFVLKCKGFLSFE